MYKYYKKYYKHEWYRCSCNSINNLKQNLDIFMKYKNEVSQLSVTALQFVWVSQWATLSSSTVYK